MGGKNHEAWFVPLTYLHTQPCVVSGGLLTVGWRPHERLQIPHPRLHIHFLFYLFLIGRLSAKRGLKCHAYGILMWESSQTYLCWLHD